MPALSEADWAEAMAAVTEASKATFIAQDTRTKEEIYAAFKVALEALGWTYTSEPGVYPFAFRRIEA